MASAASDITFVIPGQAEAAPPARAATRGTVKAAVRVGTQRGGGEPVRVTARPGEDVVVLSIANGPTLVLHPGDARDLMLAQRGAAMRSALAPAGRKRGSGAPEIEVPVQLGWPGIEAQATRGATRGWMGQALLSGFQVLTGVATDAAAELVVAAATKKVDGKVDAGLYRLSAESIEPLKGSGRKLATVPAAPDGGPMLVLVHGTFSDTVGTFANLWTLHNPTVRRLFASYGDRVYGLDHPTLGASPIANALTLVRAMPPGARIHLVTHSRGGLVAEVLVRACGGAPPTDAALALFDGANYADHRRDLRALAKEAQAKGLHIERVVRVGCPARGTLLASKRLDAYLSILTWCLELASIPVVPEVVDFLHEVARRRADPSELPGLAAMTPESPVIAWLNSASEPIASELRVIAGDMEGDSIGSWVKSLVSDAFYWTDNDLVVQTRSMYGGAPRAKTASGSGARFLLDKGGTVSHFSYFSNERTVQAIASGLLDDAPVDFAAIGPLSWAGEDASGTRAAAAVARSRGPGAVAASAATRPAVVVIPGIVGSNLKRDGQRIWLGFRILNNLKALAWDPATAASIEPDGPVANLYGDLIERLADTHEVIAFAYDWRRPVEDEARRLGDVVDAALAARANSQQPVRILAHSMGGLVARTMALEKPETWRAMLARKGARLLMLGTPNGGSWAPMQTLSGDDTFGNALAAFGSLFDNGAARAVMAGMPGFLQLQAGLLDRERHLDRSQTWQDLADADFARISERSIWHLAAVQRAIYQWSAPPQGVLDQAVALRHRLDRQAATLGADAQKMLLVIGKAPFTPGGIVLGDSGLEYLDAEGGGDGRVPIKSALLPAVRTWQCDAVHGDLPKLAEAFPAYLELLTTGETGLLDLVDTAALWSAPAARGASPQGGRASPQTTLARSRPSRGMLHSMPPSSPADVLGAAPDPALATGRPAGPTRMLEVSVLNADLKFVRQPLMLGHYRSLKLTGTEAVVDTLVDNSMSRSLDAGLYPDAPGSHQIFGNEREDPDNAFDMARPMAAVVAGLGEEGKLRVVELVHTVRQAVLAYAQRVAERDPAATQFEMAATLIGSGGTGVSAGSAAQHIAQGALEANQRLQGSRWPQLGHLILVELYLERAGDAWRALKLQEESAAHRLKVLGKVEFGPGALRRTLDSTYRGAAYDFVSALQVANKEGGTCIAYTLDTKRARTEVRALHAQGTLLQELVLKASNDANQDPRIGRTLFDLLVPVEMEPFLAGNSEMLIEVDPDTAVIPWELLNTAAELGSGDPRPWSIRCKLLRKLRLDNFRIDVTDASIDDSVLVIGEPKCDPAMYPALPGARAEANAVAACLGEPGTGLGADKIRSLLSGDDDAQSIINALFERPYRVVHVAGHGSGGPDGGVVLSGKDTYLGANEVRAMRTIPELVFLNCCHLAAGDVTGLLAKPYNRAEFAASIAEELIRAGVRCVIAAGWAVEDGPAEKFAMAFYAALLGGERFIEAVSLAREAAWRENPQGNTWAAYQCYGDPEWAWRRQAAGNANHARSLSEQFASVASPVSLALALENLAVGSEYSGANADRQLDSVRFLDSEFAALWGGMGAVAEAFGAAYAAARDVDKAIAWYDAAVKGADGSASFKAAEQLGNHLVRRAERSKNADEARRDIDEGIAQLERVAAVQATAERLSLLGSAYKRLTMVEWRAGRHEAADVALAAALAHYRGAEAMVRESGGDDLFYPAKNCISCELRSAFLAKRAVALTKARIDEVSASLQRAAADKPDFWSVVGRSELSLLEALAEGRLATEAEALLIHLRGVKVRVPSTTKWDSVYKEAQFTLEPYQSLMESAAAEYRAAAELLAALKTMAGA
jgi:CHAT domain/Lecithin:cholesterol acyltransferase